MLRYSAPGNPCPDLQYERIAGEAGRPCLVFLHEGLGCIEMWGEFPRQLCAATGCPGLVYDRAGYGRSKPLSHARTIHYMHEAALAELPMVLEALIPGQDYLLVGHSDGGSIALIHAAERPARLKGVITEAAHVFVEEITLAGIRRADAAYAAGKLQALARYHGDKTPIIFKAWSDTWLSPWFAHWNLEYLLPSIVCPLLVIQGQDDQYGTLAQVDSIVGQVSGEARAAVVEACAHSPHKENPGQLLSLMGGFILERVGGLRTAKDALP